MKRVLVAVALIPLFLTSPSSSGDERLATTVSRSSDSGCAEASRPAIPLAVTCDAMAKEELKLWECQNCKAQRMSKRAPPSTSRDFRCPNNRLGVHDWREQK